MRYLLAVLAVLAMVALGGGDGPDHADAAFVGFPDVKSRPISGPSPPARALQPFTVWYSAQNIGSGKALGTKLTITPISDPNVMMTAVMTNPPRPWSINGMGQVVVELGDLAPGGVVLAVGLQYVSAVANQIGYLTSQTVTCTNEPPANAGNNSASANIVVNP